MGMNTAEVKLRIGAEAPVGIRQKVFVAIEKAQATGAEILAVGFEQTKLRIYWRSGRTYVCRMRLLSQTDCDIIEAVSEGEKQ